MLVFYLSFLFLRITLFVFWCGLNVQPLHLVYALVIDCVKIQFEICEQIFELRDFQHFLRLMRNCERLKIIRDIYSKSVIFFTFKIVLKRINSFEHGCTAYQSIGNK